MPDPILFIFFSLKFIIFYCENKSLKIMNIPELKKMKNTTQYTLHVSPIPVPNKKEKKTVKKQSIIEFKVNQNKNISANIVTLSSILWATLIEAQNIHLLYSSES